MSTLNTPKAALRNDWQLEEVTALFELPLNELIFRAQGALRGYFDPAQIQLSTLLNIKTGACPEDCAYCPQSVRYDTGLPVEPMMQVQEVVTAAQEAKAQGATRFCMGAAWRSPKRKDFEIVLEMVKAVKGLGMETCVTLGMLTEPQVQQLKTAGLDYYNHNLDTSEAFYSQIISTRTYQDRLDTLAHVRDAQIKVCAGGIIGMGENLQDRAQLLLTLANLPAHP
ncbi:MAG: biotin synthase BioB, partial [Pseudomonadota bacterium]